MLMKSSAKNQPEFTIAWLISSTPVCHSTTDFHTLSLSILLDKYSQYPYLPAISIIVRFIKINEILIYWERKGIKMKKLDVIVWILLVIGGINWGLVGLFDFNRERTIFFAHLKLE